MSVCLLACLFVCQAPHHRFSSLSLLLSLSCTSAPRIVKRGPAADARNGCTWTSGALVRGLECLEVRRIEVWMESRLPRWLHMTLMLWCVRMGMLRKMPPAFARFVRLWWCLPRYQLLVLLRFHGTFLTVGYVHGTRTQLKLTELEQFARSSPKTQEGDIARQNY